MKVIAALLGAIPDDADDLYLPVGEGVTGRQEQVAAIAILRKDTLLPADAEPYVVEERPQWDRGGETITRIAFVRRAAGLTREEFADHWTNVHAPLARKHHPVLVRYVQNIVLENPTPTAPEVDGIAELKVDFSAMQSRLDTMDRRIDRIERRLELAKAPTPS